jgi:hypothetical protein
MKTTNMNNMQQIRKHMINMLLSSVLYIMGGWVYSTFNNITVISWRSVLLVEEMGVPGENHRPVTRH